MAGASALATAGRLAAGLVSYARIGWWGLVSPRLQEREPLVVVQAVILSASGVLLSMRSDLWGWELPGGTPLPGEPPEETVHREVWEETGIHVEVERLVGSYERSGFRPHIARVYACRVRSGVPRLSDETVGVGWFDPADPPARLFPWYREPLKQALVGGGEVLRRERQGFASIARAMAIDLSSRWLGPPGVRQADPSQEG